MKGNPARGLTQLGQKAVQNIEELGILLDVSHANDKTFWNIEAIATRPFIASHSNARSLCPAMRNLMDAQIKAVAAHGVVIGINAYREFVHENEAKQDVSHLIDHIVHIASLVGTEHIAFGFDFFKYVARTNTDTFANEDYIGTRGIEDASQVPNLLAQMRKRGFSEDDIAGMSYRNFINLLNP